MTWFSAVYVCVCVCVCLRERVREYVYMCIVCVCGEGGRTCVCGVLNFTLWVGSGDILCSLLRSCWPILVCTLMQVLLELFSGERAYDERREGEKFLVCIVKYRERESSVNFEGLIEMKHRLWQVNCLNFECSGHFMLEEDRAAMKLNELERQN